jgi:hypothetical protein
LDECKRLVVGLKKEVAECAGLNETNLNFYKKKLVEAGCNVDQDQKRLELCKKQYEEIIGCKNSEIEQVREVLGKELEERKFMGERLKEEKEGHEKLKGMWDKLKKEFEDKSMRLVRANDEILNLKTQGKDSARKQHFAVGNIDQKNMRLADEIKFLKKERRDLGEKSDRVETESAELKKENFELLKVIEDMTGRKSVSRISEAPENNIDLPNNDTESGYMTPVSCEEDLLEEIRRFNMKKGGGGLEVRSQHASGENGPNPGWGSSILGWFGGKGSDNKPG